MDFVRYVVDESTKWSWEFVWWLQDNGHRALVGHKRSGCYVNGNWYPMGSDSPHLDWLEEEWDRFYMHFCEHCDTVHDTLECNRHVHRIRNNGHARPVKQGRARSGSGAAGAGGKTPEGDPS